MRFQHFLFTLLSILFIIAAGQIIGQDTIRFSALAEFSGGQKWFGNSPFTGVAYEKHSNGKFSQFTHFKQGHRNGPSAHYYESGSKKSSFTYLNGKINGASNEWFESGNIKYQGSYLNDVREGIWKRYFENDPNLTLELFYENDVVIREDLKTTDDKTGIFEFEEIDIVFEAFLNDFKKALRENDSVRILSALRVGQNVPKNNDYYSYLDKSNFENRYYYLNFSELNSFLLNQMKFGLGEFNPLETAQYGTDPGTSLYSTMNFRSQALSDLFFDYNLTVIQRTDVGVYSNPNPDIDRAAHAKNLYYGNIDIGCINDEGSINGCWYLVNHGGQNLYIKDEDVLRGNGYTRLVFGKVKGKWKLVAIEEPPGC